MLGLMESGDTRCDVAKPPYNEAAIRTGKYDHEHFVPGMNGDLRNIDIKPATKAVLVRVSVLPLHYDRELAQATWDRVKDGKLEEKLGLCIMHCAMRSIESCLKRLLVTILEKFKAAKASDQAKVDMHLNKVLSGHPELKLRRLVSVNEKGELNDIDVSGNEVKALMRDLARAGVAGVGGSVLMGAVRMTRGALGLGVDDLDAWAGCLGHWARAMEAGYLLRPTQADRDSFRAEVRWYVMKKVLINDEALVWYDWQMFSIFPLLFDSFGSLRLICQEGMEAQQRLNNDLQRRSNHHSNSGRIPNAVKAKGVGAIAAYLKERASRVKAPARWLWEQMLLSFMAAFQGPFERMEACTAGGKLIDWEATFVPAWQSFAKVSRLRIYMGYNTRLALDERASERDSEGKVTRSRHRELLRAYHAYYAPCECEEEAVWSALRPQERVKLLKKQRRKRFSSDE